MDILGRPQGLYPERFVSIYLLEVCQEGGGSSMGVLEWYWGLLTGELGDRVIFDIVDVLSRSW